MYGFTKSTSLTLAIWSASAWATREDSLIEVPSGRFSDSVNSPWSSGGIQSRPTIMFSGNVSAKTAAAMPSTRPRWSSDQASMRP
jgi:hypothetical protein